MKALSNHFNIAIVAALPLPDGGLVAYRSSTCTWSGDPYITRSFPDHIWCTTTNLNLENLNDVLFDTFGQLPTIWMSWKLFALAMEGACWCPII